MRMMEGEQAAAATHSLFHKVAGGEQFAAHRRIIVAHHNLQRGHGIKSKSSWDGFQNAA
jgi:hypothetical protein